MHPDLRRLVLPPLRWVVPNLLPPGLTLLVSPPKTGKTWLKMLMEQAVSYGGEFLGAPVGPPRSVISISLEDNNRRLQNRHRALTPDELVPDTIGAFAHYCAWPGETFLERVAWLEMALRSNVEQGTPITLVTIDTLRKFVGGNKTGRNAYDFDCEAAQRLNDLGMKYDVAIVVPHHTNKIMVSGDDQGDWLDKISGSAGLAGSSTTIMFLERARGAETGVLHIAGWDVQDQDIPLRFQGGCWARADDLDSTEARHSGVPFKVLVALRLGALTKAELMTQTGANANTLKDALRSLNGRGEIEYNEVEQTYQRRGAERPSLRLVTEEPLPETLSEPSPTLADLLEEEPEPEIEPVPETSSGNRSIQKMVEVLSASRLRSEWKTSDDLKAKTPYEEVFLGGRGGSWMEFPAKAPQGLVKVFDRKASYYSSKFWVAKGQLRRRGPMTWEEVKEGKLAGLFQIVVPEWKERNLLSPVGELRRGSKTMITRPTLLLFRQLADRGLMEFPTILSGYVAPGSESLLHPWQEWCLERRRTAHSAEQAARFKAEDNQAFGSLRIVDPEKKPGVIDRPDWWYAGVSQHYAMMTRYAHAAVESGDPLIAVGNTDELVFEVPEDEDPQTWVPSSMELHLEAKRFAVKAIREGGEWFEAGGRGKR